MNRPPHRRAIIDAAERRTDDAHRTLGTVARLFLGDIQQTGFVPEVVTEAYADALECRSAWHELVLDREVA